MKYYIVLNPISNSDPYCIFASLKPLTKERIFSEFFKQTTVKLLLNKEDAIFYAKSLKKNSDLCKPRGFAAPIIECEIDKLTHYKQAKVSCVARMKSSDKAEKHLVLKHISYLEVPRDTIKREMFTQIIFPKKNIPSINLTYESSGCRIS